MAGRTSAIQCPVRFLRLMRENLKLLVRGDALVRAQHMYGTTAHYKSSSDRAVLSLAYFWNTNLYLHTLYAGRFGTSGYSNSLALRFVFHIFSADSECAGMHACMYIRKYVCMYVSVCICVYVCMYV
jgi:hypothetical protein